MKTSPPALPHRSNTSVIAEPRKRRRTPATALLVLGLAVSMSFRGEAEVDFSVSPAVISNTFSGVLTVTVTGLNPGQGVRLSKFLDANANGQIDPGEPLVSQFGLRDSQLPMIGGVRLTTVPGDEDGSSNGVIHAQLPVMLQGELERIAAPYLYRVGHPTNAFPAVVKPFTITPSDFGQSFTGTILSAGSPVPGAGVAALAGPDGDFVSGVAADSSGHYSLSLPPGSYQLVAVCEGYVARLGEMPILELGAGQTVTTNLPLSAATHTISGQLKVAQVTNLLPGFQAFCESDSGELTLAFTDSTGNFSFGVTPGLWSISPSEQVVSAHGLLFPDESALVDASAGSVAGLRLELPRVTALIYGSVKDDQGNPIAGLRAWCDSNTSELGSLGFTDAHGEFAVGVSAGEWWLGFDDASLAAAGVIVQSTNVLLTDGQSRRVDLVALRATAHVCGFVQMPDGSPVPDLSILASTKDVTTSRRTGADGSFDLPLVGGLWTLQLERNQALEAGLIGPSLADITVTDGVALSNVVVIARQVTARVKGRVAAGTTPIVNLWVSARATFDLTNHYDLGVNTDADGNYSLAVANGTWNLEVNCGDLQNRGYACPTAITVPVLNADEARDIALSSLPPRLSLPTVSQGRFECTVLDAYPGRSYRVWSTPDFVNWTPVGTYPGPSFQFTDLLPPEGRQRFYGVEVLP